MDLFVNTKTNYIEIILELKWNFVSPIRIFIQEFLTILLSDDKWANIISTASSELLENTIKYGTGENSKISIEYLQKDKKVHLRVENLSSQKLQHIQKMALFLQHPYFFLQRHYF